jgi:CubicO group peptidase (beta-lactamase class C family)
MKIARNTINLLTGFSMIAVLAQPGVVQAQTLADVDACYNDMVANPATSGVSGVAVAISVNGNTVLRKGYGVTSIGGSQPVQPTTRFALASTNKMMTATAVLKLRDSGAISTTSSVSSQYPGFAIEGPVTWRNALTPARLISHQGGIQDNVDIYDDPTPSELNAYWTDPDTSNKSPLIVTPGTFYNYSNSNFSLAGALVENKSGQVYSTYMQNSVFGPLGMTRVTANANAVIQDGDFAVGNFQGTPVPPISYSAVLRPAGGFWGSVDDLFKQAKFLASGNTALLSTSSFNELTTPQASTKEALDYQKYANGIFIESFTTDGTNYYDNVLARQHEGNVQGYSSSIYTLPAYGFAMAALANGDVVDFFPCRAIAVKATVGNQLPAPSSFPSLQPEATVLSNYVGYYKENQSEPFIGPMQISLSGGQLSISLPLLDSLGLPYGRTLVPFEKDGFGLSLLGSSYSLVGFRTTGSDITYLRARPFVGQRVTSMPSAPAMTQDQKTAQINRIKQELSNIRALPSPLTSANIFTKPH